MRVISPVSVFHGALCKHFNFPRRYKKYYPNWKTPYSLTDFQTLSQSKASTYEQWDNEWKTSKLPRELQVFDINRLPSYLKAKSNPSPEFFAIKCQKEATPDYRRRLFGTFGLKSTVDPAYIFQESELSLTLDKAKDNYEEKSVLEVMKRKRQREAHEKIKTESLMQNIKNNLEKMPSLINKFLVQQSNNSRLKESNSEKRKLLMEEARDRFGFYPDPRDNKFKKLREEFEQREKIERRVKKKGPT